MDYKNLLKKYIAWVGECEGVTYINSGEYYHREDHFSDEEWAELERLDGHQAGCGCESCQGE